MIKNYEDYLLYLEADKISLGRRRRYKWYFCFTDPIWTYERLLRKIEYLTNCKRSSLSRLRIRFLWHRVHKLHLGVEIPPNTFGPGLSIAHGGRIVVNHKARVGKNCRIHIDVVLGQGRDSDDVPIIGDNCHIGPGVKICGGVEIGDNTVIAANAVVTKSFPAGNCTIGGVPAKVISTHSSLTPSGNLGRGLVIEGYELALKAAQEGDHHHRN